MSEDRGKGTWEGRVGRHGEKEKEGWEGKGRRVGTGEEVEGRGRVFDPAICKLFQRQLI